MPSIDAEANSPPQPATASTIQQTSIACPNRAAQAQDLPPVPSAAGIANQSAAGPEAKEPGPATEAAPHQSSNRSQQLWNKAYDSLERKEPKLVEAYVKIL